MYETELLRLFKLKHWIVLTSMLNTATAAHKNQRLKQRTNQILHFCSLNFR